jgi:uncharacterized protein
MPNVAHPLLILMLGTVVAGCDVSARSTQGGTDTKQDAQAMANPVVHFEIPVTDLDRAMRFYRAVFGYVLTRRTVDGLEMAFFPRVDGKPGASGALAKGDVYVPAKTGIIIYFDVPDIDAALARARANGGTILYPKTDIGEAGYVAEIEDSEGNRIALSAAHG